jgi:quercetin dioxygenase-like cupin family protein
VTLSDVVSPVGHGIVSRTILSTPELRAVEFAFAAGQELTEHTSTSRALIQILSGACEFFVAGQPRVMKAGDLLHLVPNIPHALRATEPTTMLLVLAPEWKQAA